MPNAAAIVLADGQSTPANHTFNPKNQSNGIWEFMDTSPATLAGALKLHHQVRTANSSVPVQRVTIGFAVPILATVDGTQKVVRTSSAQVVFNLSSDSTEAERKDILAYVKNSLANADIALTVTSLETFW